MARCRYSARRAARGGRVVASPSDARASRAAVAVMTTPYSVARRVDRHVVLQDVVEHARGIALERVAVAAGPGLLERDHVAGRELARRPCRARAARRRPGLITVRPSAPGWPPKSPHGAKRWRSVMFGQPALLGEEPQVAPDAACRPGSVPGPAESRISSKRSMRTGWFASCDSTGMFEALNAIDIASQPSRSARAPVPTAPARRRRTGGRARGPSRRTSGWRSASAAAVTRPGRAGASAPMTASKIR